MVIKSIEWRNFKSYSNIPTKINFDSKSSVNLIVGKNGTGKSSIEEVIKYTLYGKIDDFNNSDIPNRINKNFYSKIEIDCEGHDVIIERGLAPSIFAVTIDGEKIDTAGKSNVQNMLEEIYYKMPYSVFSNTLVLSINSFKPLVDLSAADKRSIIDKIFGFDIYNIFTKLTKESYKSISSSIDKNEGSMRSFNSYKANYERQIEEIKSNEISQSEIDELQSKIAELESVYQKKLDLINKSQEVKNKLNSELTEHKGQFQEYSVLIKEIDKKINLIDSGKCPTCGSNLDTEDFQKEKEHLLAEKSAHVQKQKKLQELGQAVLTKINALDKKESQVRDELRKSKIPDLKSDLKYKTSMKEKSVEPLIKLKADIDKDLISLNEEYDELSKEKKALETMLTIFSENGIKKYIMQNYTPIINQMMFETLESMDLNYDVEFDDNFNSKITQNGYNIKYSTLSTGEKKKIDFACVITIIKFLKHQHGDSNVLFIDELFSNIDVEGVTFMIDLLKELSTNLNLNIYLIHHAQLEGIMFDKIYRTYKPDGFSRLEQIQ